LKIEYNISRIEYLLKLYRLSVDEFVGMISEGSKTPVTKEKLYSNEIELSTLKRIDKIFNKGLEYYLNPRSLAENKDASIFFRKGRFNSDLNIGAKKIVNQFEDIKISLTAISKLTDIKFERRFQIYTVNDDPFEVAQEARERLYPGRFLKKLKDFLKALISKFAENDIIVFEFVENWNKKDKANINGFFLSPNAIVLKRQQKSFRREIFTLVHELGHYLLNEEEIEDVDVKVVPEHNLSEIEKWCNNFAYSFLAGEYYQVLENIENATDTNDYHMELIDEISRETHLSHLALFTRLLYSNKISRASYNRIRENIDEEYQKKLEAEGKMRELDKLKGIKKTGTNQKPINSPLYINTLQAALLDGVISEYDFCKKLKIKPEKIDQYIQ